ncbi:MAG: hypothetical protein R3242_09410 [Akkermansiaceae bacterium]|nr:hypothetical protein [Akkermansiaceae bacterium]
MKFPTISPIISIERSLSLLAVLFCLSLPLQAQNDRKSLLNSDPEVVYLEDLFEKELKLKVIKAAPVYAHKEGGAKLGTLIVGQEVEVLAITDRAYRVRGKGRNGGLAGWVAIWAFEMPNEEFQEKMKALYERQMKVNRLIEEGQVVLGMTMREVGLILGEPTKTSVRQTPEGQVGRWEFIEYTEIRNYATHVDPYTGQVYRKLVSVTRDEKEKTLVEFKDGHVVALEESTNKPGKVRIILPQVTCHW